MPTYEYACENCGHEFERFQPITARPLKRCPVCGARKLQRLIGSGGGVIFKGSGFYQTDYRSESYKKGAEAEKSAANGGGAKTDGDGKGKSSKETSSAGKSKGGADKSTACKAD